jgi:mono/diheme cytochrome c family protein
VRRLPRRGARPRATAPCQRLAAKPGARHAAGPGARHAAALGLLWVACAAGAQDATRGAGLYLQLPGVASCVSCHGPDLLANRNGFLRAADNPQALQKALNAVGVMGYLKPVLGETEVADLAAFLGRVAPLASGEAALQVWPLTAEFGKVGFGFGGGEQVVWIRNRGTLPLNLTPPQVVGEGFKMEHDCPSTLSAGMGCVVVVRFEASVLGAATGVVSITSGATAQPVLVALGAHTVPSVLGALQWQVASPLVVFNAPAQGDRSMQRLALVNAGLSDTVLANTSVIGPQAGAFVAGGCAPGTVLAPSASCEMSVSYTRASSGAADATLQLRSDGHNPRSLALHAAATAAPTPPPPAAPAAPSGGGGTSSVGWLVALALAAWRLARRLKSRAT